MLKGLRDFADGIFPSRIERVGVAVFLAMCVIIYIISRMPSTDPFKQHLVLAFLAMFASVVAMLCFLFSRENPSQKH